LNKLMREKRISIGFPVMQEEPGEKRCFLPDFIHKLSEMGYEVYLQEGYGNSLDLFFDDYKGYYPNVHMTNRLEVFKKDYILILRSPRDEEFDLIGDQSCLISMLHFPTRFQRCRLLKEKGKQAISLDSIVDDINNRLVENLKAVGWNGLEAAFDEFEREFPHLIRENQQPWRITVIGSGNVGLHAVDAATKLGNQERNQKHMKLNGKGSIVSVVGNNVSGHKRIMQKILSGTDVLVDASQRADPSETIIPNSWLAELPENAVIVDLSVDPYILDDTNKIVKGIEGIPQGDLDQYVIRPNNIKWDDTVPSEIPSVNRRTTISCYSWPGIHPESCMRHYGQQLLPMMRVLSEKDYHSLMTDGPFFERALYRAKLDTFFRK